MLFWAETSDVPAPSYQRGRLPKRHTAKNHPFCLSAEELRAFLGAGTPLGDARALPAKIHLPTSRTGPIPSPELGHGWNLDVETKAFMAPWIIEGLWLPGRNAFGVLVNLPQEGPDRMFILGQDTLYWRKAANLVLETLALQKVVPVLSAVKGNGHYVARWQPVLDGPTDGARITQLAAAMPAVCQMDLLHPNGRYRVHSKRTSQIILESFLRSMCDALMRSWGKSVSPVFQTDDNPFHAWISALFSENPVIDASPAQLQALGSSLRAWMRNLQVSGDAVFRITFQLEAPSDENSPLTKQGEWFLHYLLQARDDDDIQVPAEEVWKETTNTLVSRRRRFENPQEKLLAGLGYAARIFPPLLPGLQTSQPVRIQLDTERAYRFMHEAVPVLMQAGFGLVLPSWWNRPAARLGVRLRLTPKEEAPELKPGVRGNLSLQKLVDYQWELAIGDTSISRKEFEALLALNSPLVQIRGKWIQLDADQIEAAFKFWDSDSRSGTMNLLQAAQYGLGGGTNSHALPLTDVVAEDWVAEWMDHLAYHEQMIDLEQPAGMQGELRPYQLKGYSWLSFFTRWGLGACLADDMGLGKTIQALALLEFKKENQQLTGPVLLVCPTSVVTNWEKEAQRFTPRLTTCVHQGPSRLRGEDFIRKTQTTDMIFTSYAVLRMDADLLKQVHWQGVILDEAQNIKNPSAKQTQSARQLPSIFRIALTGTPVENRLSELWSIMQFLNPGYLTTREAFRRNFAIPIERFGDREAVARLRKLVSPFILRRVKTDPRVIQDLPEKIEMNEYCTLVEEQARLYEEVVASTLAEVAQSDGIARKGLVLNLLLKLKQICNHPAQYLHEMDGDNGAAMLLAGRSGKLNRLLVLLEEIILAGERVLIFTQYAEMGKLLTQFLPHALGRPVQYLYGGTPVKQRDQMVRRFQEDETAPSVFILSLKAGGLGLNLTRASQVIHFDRWWNPAVENQATDRSYRIGQLHNVQVRKFITIGTLEERINEMIEAKKGLADAIIDSSEAWMTELSTEELREIVQLRQP